MVEVVEVVEVLREVSCQVAYINGGSYICPMATPLLRSAPLFAALADSTRLAILDRLRTGERNVNELCGETAAGQSLMSFHLKVLRDSGLVFSRKEGRTVWYALDPSGLARLGRLVTLLRGGDDDAVQTSTLVDLEVCREYINGS